MTRAATDDDAELDRLVAAVKPLRPLGDLARRRVLDHVGRAPTERRSLIPRLTVALLLLMTGGAVGGVAVHFSRPPIAETGPEPAAPSRRMPRPSALRTDDPAVSTAVVPAPRPASAVAAAAPHPRLAPSPPRPPAVTEPAPAHEEPATDAELDAAALAAVLRALRVDRDPARALALLDERVGWRELRDEADALRVEAALALGRSDDALSVLERSRAVVKSAALLVTRGELRAARGDHPAALADFVAARARLAPVSPEAERALIGEAICREAMGDRGGAQRAYATYVDHYPAGRFAARAQRAAERLR